MMWNYLVTKCKLNDDGDRLVQGQQTYESHSDAMTAVNALTSFPRTSDRSSHDVDETYVSSSEGGIIVEIDKYDPARTEP